MRRVPFTLVVQVATATGEAVVSDKLDTSFEVQEIRTGTYLTASVTNLVSGSPLPDHVENGSSGTGGQIPSAQTILGRLNVNQRDMQSSDVPLPQIGPCDPGADGTLLRPFILEPQSPVKLTISTNNSGIATLRHVVYLKGEKIYRD